MQASAMMVQAGARKKKRGQIGKTRRHQSHRKDGEEVTAEDLSSQMGKGGTKHAMSMGTNRRNGNTSIEE